MISTLAFMGLLTSSGLVLRFVIYDSFLVGFTCFPLTPISIEFVIDALSSSFCRCIESRMFGLCIMAMLLGLNFYFLTDESLGTTVLW